MTGQAAEIRVRDAAASGYAADYRHAKGQWWDDLERKLLVEAVRPRRTLRVLDAGSGVGRVASELARRQCTVDAIDFSVQSLRVLRDKSLSTPAAPRTVVGNLVGGLPYPDAVVDAIVSCQVVHHIPTRDGRFAVWRELARVAKPRAPLAFVVYHARRASPQEGYFSNGIFFHRYRVDELADELAACGWKLIETSCWYRLDWPAFPWGLSTLIESWCARSHLADDRAVYVFGQAIRNA